MHLPFGGQLTLTACLRARTEGVGDMSFSNREEMAIDGSAPLLLLSLVEVAEAAILLEDELSMCLYSVSVFCSWPCLTVLLHGLRARVPCNVIF